MRAVRVRRFGEPDVLEVVDVPGPTLEDGQVRIAVRVVEVLFIDTQLRAGWGTEYFPMRPPWIPGTGVAGVIAGTGAGVDASRIGETVVARTGNEVAYAEHVAVPADDAITVPPDLDLAVATAALHDGVLALDRLDRAKLQPNMRVLVTAAAGSLGQWFVPLAKRAGAHVVGASGGAVKVAAVRDLGADDSLDYQRAGWLSTEDRPFDVVFDGAGGEVGRLALERMTENGAFFGHGAGSGAFAAQSSRPDVTVVGVEAEIADRNEVTRRALMLLARDDVQPVIGLRLPLEQAARAHAAIAERRVIGKTVLTV